MLARARADSDGSEAGSGIAPRNSFDSLAETAGPDFVVGLLQAERERQRKERFGPAVRFLQDEWQEFLPELVTDRKGSHARQKRLLSDASQKLRRPLTWSVTVETDGVLEVDATGHTRVMALFLHEPQQSGGTDRFLLLEPSGVVGHNQFAPELGRSKQWRIPERDMKQIVPIDGVRLSITLLWTKALTPGRRRPQRLRYVITFERPADMAHFLESFRARSKHLFKGMRPEPGDSDEGLTGPSLSRVPSAEFGRQASSQSYQSFTRALSKQSASSLFYKEPKAVRRQRQARLLAKFATEPEEEAEDAPALGPEVLQTPIELEGYFKEHARERSAAAAKALPAAAYARYDFNLPLWRNAHVLQAPMARDRQHDDVGTAGEGEGENEGGGGEGEASPDLAMLPLPQLKMAATGAPTDSRPRPALVNNPSHVIVGSAPRAVADLFAYYTREVEEEAEAAAQDHNELDSILADFFPAAGEGRHSDDAFGRTSSAAQEMSLALTDKVQKLHGAEGVMGKGRWALEESESERLAEQHRVAYGEVLVELEEIEGALDGQVRRAMATEWQGMQRFPFWYFFTWQFLMAPLGTLQGLPPPHFGRGPPPAYVSQLTGAELEADQAAIRRAFDDRALYLFGLDHPLRRGCIRLIRSRLWAVVVPTAIVGNVVLLVLINPLEGQTAVRDKNSPERQAMIVLEAFFNIFFLAECAIMIVAYGLWSSPRAYLRSGTNVLDFVIVLTSVVDLITGLASESVGGGNLSALRSLRAAKPLRVITRSPQLRELVVIITRAAPSVLGAIGLVVAVMFVGALLGMQMFMGLLRSRCYSQRDGLLLSQQVCMCQECTALNSQPFGRPYLCPTGFTCLPLASNPGLGSESFDDIGSAMSTMLQVRLERVNDYGS